MTLDYKIVKRFIVVGLTSTAINYATFFIFFRIIGIYYITAAVIGYFSGLVFGYLLNRSWTFPSFIKSKVREFALYIAIYIASLLFNLLILRLGVEIFNINALIANIFAIGFSTCFNFLGCKFVVFNGVFNTRLKKLNTYLTTSFWMILVIKIIGSFLFASRYLTDGFLPFINFFVKYVGNPYDHFFSLGEKVFSYPGGMLFLTSWPFFLVKQVFPDSVFNNINVQNFLIHVPILILDVIIYLSLCWLLPFKKEKVLWLYFASPIVFYINYFHGQLDVIPTAILFLSFIFLFRKQGAVAFALLGLGIATKTHLLAALPFYIAYLIRQRTDYRKIIEWLGLSALTFLVLNPYLSTSGFLGMVFNNPEQRRLFQLFIPFGASDLRFLLAPAALIMIFYKFFSSKTINQDFLLLTLGLVYTVLISLVPPMPGWFYWSLPFLVFFFIKFKNAPSLSLWAMNIFFILYFIFTKDSDVFQSLSPILVNAAFWPTPFAIVSSMGISGLVLENILFTALEASLLMNIFWSYQMGVSSNRLYRAKEKPFVIAIAGDSGVGKSTLTNVLQKTVGDKNIISINGDDLHKWERGDEHWNIITHLHPKGNRVHLDLEHARSLLRGELVWRPAYDHHQGKFTNPIMIQPNRFIIFQGLLPMFLEEMRGLFHLKVYVEAADDLRLEWKLARDMGERGYVAEKVRAQIMFRQEDSFKFVQPQRNFADWIITYKKNDQGRLQTDYTFKNHIFVETLTDQLSQVKSLQVTHHYLDLNAQKVSLVGEVTADTLNEIAFQTFPNLIDLVENYPEFEDGIIGIHQLFFINFLNNFYKSQNNVTN